MKIQQPYDCFVGAPVLQGRGRTRTTSQHRRAKRSDLSASCYEEAKRSDLSRWLMEASCKQASPETNRYFYHPDHLGSSSFITDATGYAVQHLQPACRSFGAGRYLPFGETFVDQQNGYDSRYTFSAKEKDDETQYSYFGARYYDSDLSVWLSVDPLSDKYPNLSPYAYCANNPVMLVDPDGREIYIYLENDNNNKVQNAILGSLETKFSINKSINPAFALKVEGNQVKFVDPVKAKFQHDKLMDKSAKMQKKGKDVTEINAALKYYDLITGTNKTVNIYNEDNQNKSKNANETNVTVSEKTIVESNAGILGSDGKGAFEAIAKIDAAFKMTGKHTGNNKQNNTPGNVSVSPTEIRRLYRNHSNTSKHNDRPRYQDRW